MKRTSGRPGITAKDDGADDTRRERTAQNPQFSCVKHGCGTKCQRRDELMHE